MQQTIRRLLITATALVVIFTSEAFVATAKPVDDPAAPGRKSVGLVLSGGGAKGAAQLRIIKAIEEAGIPIDYIAGTSIGSIIGGLYSVGYTVEEIEELFTSMNWFNIFTDRNERSKQLLKDKHKDDAYMFDAVLSADDISLPSGIVRGDKFMDELNELLLGYQQIDSFDNLPIPFASVSYDMNTGSEYVARGGSLPIAIRASMSIPGVFTPVRHKDMLLVDGGVYNNFPVDVARDMGADIVIGVDLADGIRTDDDLANMVLIFEQLTTFLGRDKYEANLASCDYYMHPEVAPYTAASFNAEAVDSLIMRGQVEADRHRVGLQELRKKIGLPEGYMPPKRQRHYSSDTKLYIGPIHFKGFNKSEQALINRYLNLRPYTTVTRKEFNKHIEDVRNVGGFEFVRYSLNNRAPYELIIGVNEKENASVHVGFRFDSQELASLLLATEMTMHGNYFKPKFALKTRLSQSPYVQLSASSSRVFFGDFTFAYKYQYHDFTFYKNEVRQNSANFDEHNLSIRFSDIYLRNFNMGVGVEYDFFDFRHSLYYNLAGNLTEAKPEGYINYVLNGHYESLDDFYMPRKGWSVRADYTVYTTNGWKVKGGNPFTALQYTIKKVLTPWDGPLTFIGSLYGRSLIGPRPTYPYQNSMGGILPGRYMEQQMPFVGIQRIELCENSVMVGAIEARYEFFKNHTLSAVANYALQNDNFWEMFDGRQSLLGFGVKYTYHTSLGPLTVLASGTNDNPLGGLYVSFGKNF
ncbi:MAG: patatin-like phospholipase family protein [Tidjanibacter sp.]|nr:patatin-like phospholipase family protein [Tidjanibacter sp.]